MLASAPLVRKRLLRLQSPRVGVFILGLLLILLCAGVIASTLHPSILMAKRLHHQSELFTNAMDMIDQAQLLRDATALDALEPVLLQMGRIPPRYSDMSVH